MSNGRTNLPVNTSVIHQTAQPLTIHFSVFHANLCRQFKDPICSVPPQFSAASWPPSECAVYPYLMDDQAKLPSGVVVPDRNLAMFHHPVQPGQMAKTPYVCEPGLSPDLWTILKTDEISVKSA